MTGPTTSPIEDELFCNLPFDSEPPEPYGADIHYREQAIPVEVSTDE